MKNTHGSRYLLILPDTVKIMFNVDIKATDKTRSVVGNVGRAEQKFANLTCDSQFGYLLHL